MEEICYQILCSPSKSQQIWLFFSSSDIIKYNLTNPNVKKSFVLIELYLFQYLEAQKRI